MTASPIRILSPAKINLALHVIGRRNDGYHALDSLVAFADEGDEMTIEPADTFSFEITGPYEEDIPHNDSNLAILAARELQKRYDLDLNIKLSLNKALPPSSGLGGGSGNAAATIAALIQFYDLNIDNLDEILLSLGADVPVCYRGVTQGGLWRMRGIGEQLELIGKGSPRPALLINPGIASPTENIFSALQDPNGAPMENINDLNALRNDLTAPAIAFNPVIEDVLNTLEKHANLARMSGSGATCFGFFDTPQAAYKAAQAIKAHPEWWIQFCYIGC